jgi:hypothetical protein
MPAHPFPKEEEPPLAVVHPGTASGAETSISLVNL